MKLDYFDIFFFVWFSVAIVFCIIKKEYFFALWHAEAMIHIIFLKLSSEE